MSKLAKILGATIAASWLLMGVVLFTAHACECCADPVIKVEWHDEWVYEIGGPETIVVTGTERLLCYEVVGETAIEEIGDKAGQVTRCHYPQGEEQARGCIEADWHDLSNVSFCNGGPTAVELLSFTARAWAESFNWPYFAFSMFILALVVIVAVGRRR